MKYRNALITLISLNCVSNSSAATAVWTSTAGGTVNWSEGANWSGAVAPLDGDDIELGIPVASGARITNNDSLTSINSLWLKANLITSVSF